MQSDYSPLFFAAASGDLSEIRALAPEAEPQDLNQALAQAAGLSRFDAAELLLEFRADPRGTYSKHFGSVLFPACEWMNPEGIRWLLEHGADPNQATEKGENALDHLLASHVRSPNKYRCIGLLIKAGAEAAQDAVMAIHKGNLPALQEALDADPDALHRPLSMAYGLFPLKGASLLHLTAEYNEIELATELLQRGLDVNSRATSQPSSDHPVWPTNLFSLGEQSALYHAAGHSRDMLEFLLERGADPGLRAPFGREAQTLQLTAEDFFQEVDLVESNRLEELNLLRGYSR